MTSTISVPSQSPASNGMNGNQPVTSETYRHGKVRGEMTTGTAQASLIQDAEPGSDSEAETVVLTQSRGRNRTGRSSKFHEHSPADESINKPGASSASKLANGGGGSGSKLVRDDSGDNQDDAYSSDLSSAPSNAPSSVSRRPYSNDYGRKRTASPSRLTHSPPRKKIPKLQESETLKRKSLKRKIREDSLDRGGKTDDCSPSRGVRVKSSPPVSPPPPVLTSGSNISSSKSTVREPSSASATVAANVGGSIQRAGHTRTRSVQSNVVSSSIKSIASAKSSGKSKRSIRPAPLHFHDHSDNEGKSTSSSRSNSPNQLTQRKRRPSLSGAAASPARTIAAGHKMKRDKTGRTLFHKVCQKDDLEEAKMILDAEPELLNDADNAGYLPIHVAALEGNNDIVQWLIQRGAFVDKPAHQDLSTPLMDAVENMHTDVVNTLLEYGANPSRKNRQGQSSLDTAATARQERDDPEEIAKITLIEEALKTAMAKLRAKRRAEEEARKAASSTAHESNSSRAPSIASPTQLSPPPQSGNQVGANPRKTRRFEQSRNEFLWLDAGKGGQAKLKQAARDGDMEMAGKLMESGLKPDPESVMLAARGGHLDVLGILMAFGGDSDPDPKEVVRQHNKDKSNTIQQIHPGEETPILASIGRNNIDVLKLLLKSESFRNPRRLDQGGRSYAEIARSRAGENWEEEVRLLQKAWDDAGPVKSKKSSRERRDASPATHKRERDRERDKEQQQQDRKMERREAAAKLDEAKKAKRLRRRSASAAPSSIQDDTAPSEREISPVLARTKTSDADRKQKRKGGTADSDFSAVSDSNPDTVKMKKQRRLVLGKDLASKSTKSRDERGVPSVADTSHDEDQEHSVPKKKKKSKPPSSELLPPPAPSHRLDSEDVDMTDAAGMGSTPVNPSATKKRATETDRPTKRDLTVQSKRPRESTSTESIKASANESNHPSDSRSAMSSTTVQKKRRKTEESLDGSSASQMRKSKEDRAPDSEARHKSKGERNSERERRENGRADDGAAKQTKAKDKERATSLERPTRKEIDDPTDMRKKKRRDETATSTDMEPVKGRRDRDHHASDAEARKPRADREARLQVTQEKDMDADAVSKSLARKAANDNSDEPIVKPKKRKSDNTVPSASAQEEKFSSRHLSDLPNGKSNRGSGARDEVRPKLEPLDDDTLMTDVAQVDFERHQAEAEQRRIEAKLAEDRLRDEERTKQAAVAAAAAIAAAEEKERQEAQIARQKRDAELAAARKQLCQRMSQLGEDFLLNASDLLDLTRNQSVSLHLDNHSVFHQHQAIRALPLLYREARYAFDKESFANQIWADFGNLLPLNIVVATDSCQSEQEQWISNAQAALILGCGHDLEMRNFPSLEKRQVSRVEQAALSCNLYPVYSSFRRPEFLEFDADAENYRQEVERAKFDALENLFWMKVSDLYSILRSNASYQTIVQNFMQRGTLPTSVLCVNAEF